MRIVAWNVENLAKRIGDLAEAHASLGSPDVLCLQEIRVRAQDADVVAALEAALPGYVCHHSLPRDPHNVTYRGGRAYGVTTYVRGDARGAVPGWDREGRLVVSRVGALSIVNLYAVNGTAKPYFDESGKPTGDRHAFKRRFQVQVIELGKELARDGDVVLAGDWNVTPTALDTHPRLRTEGPHARARAELADLIAEAGFVDIWRAQHPGERGYTWFNPRARKLDAARVDYILVSPGLAPKVRASRLLERHPWSDHAPIEIELTSP